MILVFVFDSRDRVVASYVTRAYVGCPQNLRLGVAIRVSATWYEVDVRDNADGDFVPDLVQWGRVQDRRHSHDVDRFMVDEDVRDRACAGQEVLGQPRSNARFRIRAQAICAIGTLREMTFLVGLPITLPFMNVRFVVREVFIMVRVMDARDGAGMGAIVCVRKSVRVVLIGATALAQRRVDVHFKEGVEGVDVVILAFCVLGGGYALVPRDPRPSDVVVLVGVLTAVIRVDSLVQMVVLEAVVRHVDYVHDLLHRAPRLECVLVVCTSRRPLRHRVLVR